MSGRDGRDATGLLVEPTKGAFLLDAFLTLYLSDERFQKELWELCAGRDGAFLLQLKPPTKIPNYVRRIDEVGAVVAASDVDVVKRHLERAHAFQVEWGLDCLPLARANLLMGAYYMLPENLGELEGIRKQMTKEAMFLQTLDPTKDIYLLMATAVVFWDPLYEPLAAAAVRLDAEYKVKRAEALQAVPQVLQDELGVTLVPEKPMESEHLRWLYERIAYGKRVEDIADEADERKDAAGEGSTYGGAPIIYTDKYVRDKTDKYKKMVGLLKMRHANSRKAPDPVKVGRAKRR